MVQGPKVQSPKSGTERMRRGELTEAERLEFLRRLDNAHFDITDWEAEFLDSILRRRKELTERQVETIDKLIMRYGERLKF